MKLGSCCCCYCCFWSFCLLIRPLTLFTQFIVLSLRCYSAKCIDKREKERINQQVFLWNFEHTHTHGGPDKNVCITLNTLLFFIVQIGKEEKFKPQSRIVYAWRRLYMILSNFCFSLLWETKLCICITFNLDLSGFSRTRNACRFKL